MKKETGCDLPRLHLRYIVMKHNEHELERLPSFAAEHKFDILTIRTLSIIDGPENVHFGLVPDNKKYRAYTYENNRRIRRQDFYDEKAFILHNEPRRQWVESMDELKVRVKEVVEPSVRVWAAISDQGWSAIYKIPPYWKSDDYIDFLKKKGMPDIRKRSGGDFVFQQDGDGAPSAKKVRKYFDESGIEVLSDFPSRSPDLSPIENEWANLTRRLENTKVTTKDGLWKNIRKEWGKMAQGQEGKLAKDVRRRLKEVKALKGRVTKH
jgi:hypothetical protein